MRGIADRQGRLGGKLKHEPGLYDSPRSERVGISGGGDLFVTGEPEISTPSWYGCEETISCRTDVLGAAETRRFCSVELFFSHVVVGSMEV